MKKSFSFLGLLVLFLGALLGDIPSLFSGESGKIMFMETPDGAKIRYVHYEPLHSCHKTILILQGRSSFIEKHEQTIQDFLDRGFDVWAFDWRGQGGSTRIVNHPQKNHIDSYELYLADLNQLIHQHIHPQQKGPLILFASSMGGHLALRYVEDYPGMVQGAILESPMFHVPTAPFPFFLARPLVRLICALGFSQSYVFGWGDFNPKKEKFKNNKMTHDEQRFERQREICLRYPELLAAGPTFGWVKATFDSIDKLMNPKKLESIHIPFLIINSGLDTIVNTEFDQEISHRLPQAHFKTYPDAHHHIILESEPVRQRFWEDISAFLNHYFSKETSHGTV